jgi:hypothetical protein
MELAQQALDAASKLVVDLGNERGAIIEAAKDNYAKAEEMLRETRDKKIDDTRAEYKAKLSAARAAETKARNTFTELVGKQAQFAARARAGKAE